jgi:UDP-N-acetyl-D-glucosamine dehydrogenase
MPPSSDSPSLLARFKARDATVCILGLGYVGLPLAATFWRAGFRVLGFDIDTAKIVKLCNGQSYIGHLDSSLISQMVNSGKFEATHDAGRLDEPDALIICVPTPLTHDRLPDLSYIESTCELIAPHLRAGQLVVLESTTYPGTTRQVVQPILEKSGLLAGRDFHLAYSPEREDPGNPKYSTAVIPKVIGGVSENCLTLADALYSQAVVKTVPVSSCEVAEACKILENTYRAVNIALVNELKPLFEKLGIDLWEVIDAAKTKPFGFQAFYPGPGLGGHCIPIDPFYLSWLARREGHATRFIELAGEINTAMPHQVVAKLADVLRERFCKELAGAKIGILGVAYKKDVDDPRESPAFVILEDLLARGASVSYHDPHVPVLPKMRQHALPRLESQAITQDWLAEQDAVVIVTDHAKVDYELVARASRLVVDTRNVIKETSGKGGNIVGA